MSHGAATEEEKGGRRLQKSSDPDNPKHESFFISLGKGGSTEGQRMLCVPGHNKTRANHQDLTSINQPVNDSKWAEKRKNVTLRGKDAIHATFAEEITDSHKLMDKEIEDQRRTSIG